MKQIKKLPEEFTEKYMTYMDDMLSFILNEAFSKAFVDKYFKVLKIIKENGSISEEIHKIIRTPRRFFDNIDEIHRRITSLFLDFYYVFRTFKLPVDKDNKKEENSIVSVGYFGDYHSENISYLLCNIFDTHTEFKIISSTDDRNPYKYDKYDQFGRCLDFTNESINLDDLIRDHKKKIPILEEPKPESFWSSFFTKPESFWSSFFTKPELPDSGRPPIKKESSLKNDRKKKSIVRMTRNASRRKSLKKTKIMSRGIRKSRRKSLKKTKIMSRDTRKSRRKL
jgi:hypothetical protein